MEEVLNEAVATHDDDFGEHLDMHRKHTFRGKEKDSFVHIYGRKPRKKTKESDDSHDRLHGIMNYHGYEETQSKSPDQVVFKKEDRHKAHKVAGNLNNKGEVAGIIHHERFKDVNESKINEAKTFGKTLRSIAPKKSSLDGDELNSPAAPSERANQKKLLGLKQILKVPDANGNPEDFATSKSPGKKALGPGAGKTEPQTHVKEELDEDSSYAKYQKRMNRGPEASKEEGRWSKKMKKQTADHEVDAEAREKLKQRRLNFVNEEELDEATHIVHIEYDDPHPKGGTASIRVPVSTPHRDANVAKNRAKASALKKITQFPHEHNAYPNARVHRVELKEEVEEFQFSEEAETAAFELLDVLAENGILDAYLEQIDEISKELAGNYVKKALKSADDLNSTVHGKDNSKAIGAFKKLRHRDVGIRRGRERSGEREPHFREGDE